MNSIPFADPNQQELVPSNEKKRVFYFKIPEGMTGFIYKVILTKVEGIEWFWYIDDEIVPIENEEEDFDPPYLVKKYVEFEAKNNTINDLLLNVSCQGMCYGEEVIHVPTNVRLTPVSQEAYILREIKEELKQQVPQGVMSDKLAKVTDEVTVLYNEKEKGLNWSAFTIRNAGPDNVYLCVNKWRMPEAPLPEGETEHIDLGQKKAIKKVFLVCDPGETATVGIHYLK